MRLTTLLFTLCVFCSIHGQDASEIRRVAAEALAAFDTPGFAVGVVKDGEVLVSEGFGLRTKGQPDKVDGNTLFAIASNTKAFISTALGKLHAEGKVDLDAPVRNYLPYFELYDEYVTQHTTVRDLLCHRVGLGTFSGDAIWYKSEKDAEAIIRQIRHLPQAYEWRAGYGYTNLMFITAGEVIRAVTGQSWDAYVREQFLKPLGMERTQTSVSGLASLDNIATPHITKQDNKIIELAPWEASGAAGGIISSTDDLLKWLAAQLNAGTVGGKEIFPKSVLEETFKAHNIYGPALTFRSVGLGWFLYERAGETIVTHGGGYDGMYSQVIMIPNKQVAIVILTNSMTRLSGVLSNYLRDRFLGLEVKDGWLERAAVKEANDRTEWQEKFVEISASKSSRSEPQIPVADYLGTYRDPLFGDFKVAMGVDGRKELQFVGSPALNAKLSHWQNDTWKLEWNEPHAWFDLGTVQFITNNRGKVTGLKFDVPNDDIFFEELEPVKVD